MWTPAKEKTYLLFRVSNVSSIFDGFGLLYQAYGSQGRPSDIPQVSERPGTPIALHIEGMICLLWVTCSFFNPHSVGRT